MTHNPHADDEAAAELMAEPQLCECNHTPTEHQRRTGKCNGLDSYNQPCTCPSYVEDPNTIED